MYKNDRRLIDKKLENNFKNMYVFTSKKRFSFILELGSCQANQ